MTVRDAQTVEELTQTEGPLQPVRIEDPDWLEATQAETLPRLAAILFPAERAAEVLCLAEYRSELEAWEERLRRRERAVRQREREWFQGGSVVIGMLALLALWLVFR